MKRAFILGTLLLAACASTQDSLITPPPDVGIEQIYGPSSIPYSRGTQSIIAEYAITVANKSEVPITLKRVDMQSVAGTTIAMRREDRSYNVSINPGSVETVKINPRIYFTSTGSSTPTNEPLTIRAILHFDSPRGTFRRIVTRTISQFPE